MNTQIYSHVNDLKGFSIKNCPSIPNPGGVLMCPPANGSIAAKAQWDSVKASYEQAGKSVRVLQAPGDPADLVFAASQAFCGVTSRMERICVPSHFRSPGRRKDPVFEEWFKSEGYQVRRLSDSSANFEGMSDCRWHPGKRLLWGGYGFRTDPEVYEELAEIFEAPVARLKLVNERFSRLGSCFCPLNQEAALIYPPAFDAQSLELILKLFPIVLAVDESEAAAYMPCNAAIVDGRLAIIQKGASAAVRHLKAVGFNVVEVDAGEFARGGGSVFSLGLPVF